MLGFGIVGTILSILWWTPVIFHAAGMLPVVLFIGLPGMSGIELQARLKVEQCGIPIIFITARGDIPLALKSQTAIVTELDAIVTMLEGVVAKPRRCGAMLVPHCTLGPDGFVSIATIGRSIMAKKAKAKKKAGRKKKKAAPARKKKTVKAAKKKSTKR